MALNMGNEIRIVNSNGWLVKKYTSDNQIKNVVIGDSDLVEKINSIALEEGIKAAVEVRKKLENLLIPEEWVTTAIRTCTTGGIKSYLEDDLGHFGEKVVEKLENI